MLDPLFYQATDYGKIIQKYSELKDKLGIVSSEWEDAVSKLNS
jgi:hypothetical protein